MRGNGMSTNPSASSIIDLALNNALWCLPDVKGAAKVDRDALTRLRTDALRQIHSALLSRMPEKKDTSYMKTPYGINHGKDTVVAQSNGYNAALTDITKVLNDFFGDNHDN